MKASTPRLLAFVATMVLIATGTLMAQSTVILKDGTKRDGEVTGVRDDKLRIKIGPVETALPLASVESVEMPEPADYQAASETWKSGNAAAARAKLEPVVLKFKGLPAPWAERATSMLPELYLAEGRLPEAEKTFLEFKKLYPNAGSSSDLLQARLALSKKDYSTARAKLGPLVENAKKTLLPAGPAAVASSQAVYLLGEVQEQAGDKSEALGNYLLVTTLFKADASSVARAQERADVLQKDKVIVP